MSRLNQTLGGFRVAAWGIWQCPIDLFVLTPCSFTSRGGGLGAGQAEQGRGAGGRGGLGPLSFKTNLEGLGKAAADLVPSIWPVGRWQLPSYHSGLKAVHDIRHQSDRKSSLCKW
jgi:hypothetical protein